MKPQVLRKLMAPIFPILFVPSIFVFSVPAQAAHPLEDLPLLTLGDFTYEGAFRLPADEFGNSSLNYSEGPLVYDPTNHAVFIVGHAHHQAVAEFAVPALIQSTVLADLEIADPPLQEFETVLDRVSGGNGQSLDRIGGLALVEGPIGSELLVNAYEYYDAPGDNTETTAVVRQPEDLAVSPIDGFFSFSGGAGHTSGWMSPVPLEWQPILGGSYITGQSSGIPIIGRTSVGPSAFAFEPGDVITDGSVPDPVPTTKLLDFDLAHPLHADLSNDSGTNDLWTHLSRVTYGFIVPGTRTYVTLGYSGGHVSGVCYKCIQLDGYECGGYCPPDPDDVYQYYWLWDLNDLVSVKDGTMNSWDVLPYEYGEFATPFEVGEKAIGGGSFDADSGLLYLTIQKADREQGTYANPPVVVAYRVALSPTDVRAGGDGEGADRSRASGLELAVPQPNPVSRESRISLRSDTTQQVLVTIHDVLGRLVTTIFNGSVENGEDLHLVLDRTGLASGVYLVRAQGTSTLATRRIVVRAQ